MELSAKTSMSKRDYIYLAVILLVYGFIAFYKLGNTVSPQISWIFPQDSIIIVDFGELRNIDEIQYMSASFIDRSFVILFSQDNENWIELPEMELEKVFFWHSKQLKEPFPARYVIVSPVSDYVVLQEMAFRENGELIPIVSVTEDGMDLFDEQQYVPNRNDYMNSTYFDEIYHVRTAYEFVYKLPPYEWTHPPLGKFIISQGIKQFGMTPFGWRFSGTFFGVLMLIPIYLLAKRIFKNENWAFLAAFVFAFDFMHYTQTRIATIDTYVTIFVLLMYYFMYLYSQSEDKPLYKQFFQLAASGVSFGLALASKWQGAYAAVGLAIIFFIYFFQRLKEKKLSSKQAVITIGSCFIFFIFIPVVVYCLAYIPFLNTYNNVYGLKGIIENAQAIYYYHSNLVDEHPYTSRWWTWPLMLKPMLYYIGDFGEGMKQGISAFGNPAVWWVGVPAFFYCLYSAIKQKSMNATFLVIAYLSQYIPWVFISRTTYIYHYFPSVPFVVLMIVYTLKNVAYEKNRNYVYAYAISVILLFVMFYPLLSGVPAHESYLTFFKWLPSWQLYAPSY